MKQRPAALTPTLIGLHAQADARALLPFLLRGVEPELGHAVAACYVCDAETDAYRLDLLTDLTGAITLERLRTELGVPLSLGVETLAPLVARLTTGGEAMVVKPLPGVLAGLWPERAVDALARATDARCAALARVGARQQPGGLLLLFAGGGWPVASVAEAAGHAAVALANLIEQRSAAPASAEVVMRGVIEQAAAREINRAERYKRNFSLAVIEVPEEQATPLQLIAMASVVERVMRQPDTAGHLDQRRVVVLLPETPATGAATFIRRLQKQAGPEMGLRCGAATFGADGATWAELVSQATSRLAAAPVESEPVAGATLRVRVSTLTAGEVGGWGALLRRLPGAGRVDLEGFDGSTATFVVVTPSVARLLGQLRQLAGKVSASFATAVTGEVGLTLHTPGAKASRYRAMADTVNAGLHPAA